ILSFVRSIDKDKGKKLSVFYQNQITLIADS
ncbi:RNA-directed DNA polymerase, partial [Serratia marcescens]